MENIELFFYEAEDGIRGVERSGGVGDVYKGQAIGTEVLRQYILQIGSVQKIIKSFVFSAPIQSGGYIALKPLYLYRYDELRDETYLV